MSDIVVRAENLGKQYRIGGKQESYKTIRETITRIMATPFRRLAAGRGDAPTADFWALRDVSFEVHRGEVLGVIGRNGAGKSTLLKILSKITEPTKGVVYLKGRVGSLLEVGTGFHPELTGRENIYLNGAILGMKRPEISRKFDEIVAFAEVERFIDTPVKRYSSGMYLRLAFSVAAHLESEILLVDEVLAVGDARFREKCLSMMRDVTQEGRTVIFVSHDMTAMVSLCHQGIWLDVGNIVKRDEIASLVRSYLSDSSIVGTNWQARITKVTSYPFYVSEIVSVDAEGSPKAIFLRSEEIRLHMVGEVRISSDRYIIAIDIRNEEDVLLFRTHDVGEYGLKHRKIGTFDVECIIPAELLPTGKYRVTLMTVSLGTHEFQNENSVIQFEVVQDEAWEGLFLGTRGVLTPKCSWKML